MKDFKTSEVVALVGLGIFLVVAAVMGIAVIGNAIDVAALLPDAKPTRTPIPGISSVGENVSPTKPVGQPYIAEEIERISDGKIDLLHIEERGDFSAVIVMWVKGELTDAQFNQIYMLIASEYGISRLVVVASVPQLDNMVFVISKAFDCVSYPDSTEAPLRCAEDQSVLPGYVVPDEGLDLLNE
jgi:hypothetical protein